MLDSISEHGTLHSYHAVSSRPLVGISDIGRSWLSLGSPLWNMKENAYNNMKVFISKPGTKILLNNFEVNSLKTLKF
jgi:hypothetical protein